MKLVIWSALILFLSGCLSAGNLTRMPEKELYKFKRSSASIKQKYRAELIRRHPEWPSEVKGKVLSGHIDIGMTKEQVLSSIGQPAEILGKMATDADEHAVWVYKEQYLEFAQERLVSIYVQQDELDQE